MPRRCGACVRSGVFRDSVPLLHTGGTELGFHPKYREGFLGFHIEELARSSPAELLARPGIIRNTRKIEAVIHNAREFETIAREQGSFTAYLETLKPLTEAERIKALGRRFKQVGPESADYFLHSVGFGE